MEAVGAVGNVGGVTILTGVIGQPGLDGFGQIVLGNILAQGGGCVIAFLLLGGGVLQAQLQELVLVALGLLGHGFGGLFQSGQSVFADGFLTLGGLGGQVELIVGDAVKVAGIFRIISIHGSLVIVQLAVNMGGVFLCGVADGGELQIAVHIAARAVGGGHISVGAAETGHAGVQLQHLGFGLQRSLCVLAQGVAVGNSLIIDGVGAGGAVQSEVHQIVMPGLEVLGHVFLLAQGLFGIGHVAQQLRHFLISGSVVEVQHGGGQLVTVGDAGGGVGGEEAAADHAQEDNGSDQNDCDDGVQDLLGGLAHALFGLGGGDSLGADLFLALFLFAGCAHVVVHSSHASCCRVSDTR